jgi:hypothetical protein
MAIMGEGAYFSSGNCKGFHPPWRVVRSDLPFTRKMALAALAIPSTMNTRRMKLMSDLLVD